MTAGAPGRSAGAARCHRAKKPLPVRAELGRDLRVVMKPGCCDLRGRAFEWPLAGEAFDEHETERVDIDTRTYGPSLDLFGSEVGGVPSMNPAAVIPVVSTSRAIPKSARWAVPA